MKELLTVLAVLFSGVVGEAQAPYPASGWRPSGPAFELPQGTQRPLKQEYLPPSPVDPRVPAVGPTALPGDDVSVQGLPAQEQLPIFQVSPVNGQQYAGPSFNADLQNLDQNFRQSQFQLQQQKAREFERQRQLDAQLLRRQSTPQTPRQFVQKTTITPEIDESKTTQFDSTTEAISLNEGETLEDDSRPAVTARQKVSVEVTKQNIQEYPPELFLSPLTQLNYQPRLVPLEKLSQLRAYQPIQQDSSQKQVAQGFDGLAHLSALTSILTQRQGDQPEQQQYSQGFAQGPIVFIAGGQTQASDAQAPEPQYQQVLNQYQPLAEQEQYQPQLELQQYQPQQVQPQQLQPQLVQPQQLQPQLLQPQQYQPQQFQPQQYQPQQIQPQQFQPQQFQPQQYQPQNIQPQQFQPQQFQPQQYQPQQYQPQVMIQPVQPNPASQNDAEQLQLVYQQTYQPNQLELSQIQQPQYDQNLFLGQNQDLNQYYLNQQQFLSRNQGLGPQDALQSGLDINQQGNDIDEVKKNTDEENQGATATAVATAFGTRTQPRIPNQYGVPASNPRTRTNPGFQTTTEVYDGEEVTENTATVAQATAVARGDQRKNAKLSSRRVRPVFTLDRSGHLVLAREQ